MPGHGADHHSPFPGAASSCGAPGKSLKSVPVTGQTFRKGGVRISGTRTCGGFASIGAPLTVSGRPARARSSRRKS